MRLIDFPIAVALAALAATEPTQAENEKGREKRRHLRGLQDLPSGQRLRDLAVNIPRGVGGTDRFRIGYASRSGFASGDAEYMTVAAREFDKLTCENDMKMENLQPTQGSFNYGPADEHVGFAQSHGMEVHGHTLVWHNQIPWWVTGGEPEMRNHISTVVGKYKGIVSVWDVVNEAFDEDGNLRQTIWQQNIGTGDATDSSYIKSAFEEAHVADPSAKLILNDYSVAWINSKSNAMFDLAKDLKDQGVPIHGVGFQCHLTENGMNYQSFADNMQRFANAGLEIYITELDVRIADNGSTRRRLQNQARVYENVVRKCMEQAMCMELSTWGFTDRYSWIPGWFPGEGRALPFDNNYAAKPAYYAIQSVLEEYQGTGSTAAPPATSTSSSLPPPSTAAPPSGPVASVESVEVAEWQNKPRRKQAQARVKIIDGNGAPVENALVHGQWEEATNDLEASTTYSNGLTAWMYSDKIGQGGRFKFCVTAVSAAGMAWDEVQTCGDVEIV